MFQFILHKTPLGNWGLQNAPLLPQVYRGLHVFHRQLAHRVSGARYQAKKKTHLVHSDLAQLPRKKKDSTWLTLTWLRYQEKKSEYLDQSDLVQIGKPGQLYVAQIPSRKKREYLAQSNLAQIPSKKKGEHLAHSDLAQIPSRKKKRAPGPKRYQATNLR